jgi:predicted nucleic acid-binding protein
VIGLDTNVLVRYVMQDDPTTVAARHGLSNPDAGSEPGFVPLVVVVELVWVLSGSYGLARAQLAAVLESAAAEQGTGGRPCALVTQAAEPLRAAPEPTLRMPIERSPSERPP